MKYEAVSIVPCATYDKETVKAALLKALLPIGGLDWVKKGMRVGLKANLVSFAKPEAAVTTHPAVLVALTELLLARGASVVVGDSPGGLWTPAYVNRIYAASGMKEVEAAGATLNHNYEERVANNPNAVQAKTFCYTAYLDDCDAIVDVCKLKSHGMMGLSCAAKNMFGVVPGIMKPEYHYRYPDPNDFADMILDLDAYFPPVLSIADAVVAMEGNGPTQGTPRPLNCLLASKSPHCLDLAAARLIGLAIEDVPTLAAALRRGLIPDSLDKLTVHGAYQPLCVRDFQLIKNHNSLLFHKNDTLFERSKGWVLEACLGAKPLPQKTMCIGCKKCANICPAKAITMQSGLPVIDRKQCIKCFCCQEFCPTGAMQVYRPLVARIINK